MVRGRTIGAVLTTTALAGLLQLATTLGATPALACSCAPMTDAEYVGSADVIFAGTLLDRKEPPSGSITSSGDLVTLTFAVSEVYKGQVGTTTQVRTASSGASCGLELDDEGPFLVFTTFDKNGLTASLCGGTRDLPERPPAALGPGRPPAGSGQATPFEPTSGGGGRGDASETGDGIALALWITGGAAGTALVGWLAYRKVRRRPAG